MQEKKPHFGCLLYMLDLDPCWEHCQTKRHNQVAQKQKQIYFNSVVFLPKYIYNI